MGVEDGPGRPEPPERPGWRVGPVTFVLTLRREPDDPWAHRKGEPRLFALMWTVYLMGAAVLTVLGSRLVDLPEPEHGFAARALLVMAAIGVCVLWPMTRISQAPPERPVRATLADLIVVLAPLQAMVWPLPLLTRWPMAAAGALTLMITSWAVLIGAIVLAGATSRSAIDRCVWMLACLVLIVAGPAVQLAAPPRILPEAWGMTSPLTGVYALTRAPSGLAIEVSRVEWTLAAGPGVAGLAGWVIGAASVSRRRPGR